MNIFRRRNPLLDREPSDKEDLYEKLANKTNEPVAVHKRLPDDGKMFTGVVKRFFDEKGFGFILDSDNQEYFVWYSDIIQDKGFRSLAKGQKVKAVGYEGPKGLYAKQVEVFK